MTREVLRTRSLGIRSEETVEASISVAWWRGVYRNMMFIIVWCRIVEFRNTQGKAL